MTAFHEGAAGRRRGSSGKGGGREAAKVCPFRAPGAGWPALKGSTLCKEYRGRLRT